MRAGGLRMHAGAGALETAFNEMLMKHRDEVASYFDPSIPGHALGELAELKYELETWRYTLTPQVVSQRELGLLERGVRGVMAGIDFLLAERFQNDSRMLAEVLRLESWKAELFHVARNQDWARIARPDVVRRDGVPHVLELNAGTWLGGLAESDLLARTIRAWPRADRFLQEAGARSVDTMDALAENIRKNEPPGLVVIPYWGCGQDNMTPIYRGDRKSVV